MADREKVIGGLESLRDVCNAKADMAIGEGRTAWAGYASVAHLALALLREQEVGKWIKLQGMAPPEYHGHKICSVCESFAPYDPIHPWREMLSPYCPGCGAKMEVSADA